VDSAARRRGPRRALGLLGMMAIGLLAGSAYVYWTHRSDNPGCTGSGRSDACTRVLFFGNSYTSVNDLPTMFGDLAWSGGHRVETGTQAPGGWTLADHARSHDTPSLLASKPWDFVVLQEQSEIPSIESFRQSQMYPAARELVSMIRAVGAKPVFYVTWAHKTGSPQNGMPGYLSMQSAIDTGYVTIAAELNATLAPVGFAWMTLYKQPFNMALWQDDGSHPTTAGTYMAASVFYATLFGESPVGLNYHADLSDSEAAKVQEVAATTVLGDRNRWVTS
jgi:hypothetical protein